MKYATEKHGTGSFLDEFISEDWDKLMPRDLARKLGDVAGCPVVERLTDPENDAAGRGPDAMIERYAEVAFWHGRIVETVREANPELALELTQSVERKEGDMEKMYAYDHASIPDDHFERMSPIGTLYGYALPRVLIEAIRGKDGSDDSTDAVQDRLVRALEALDTAAKTSDNPYDLTAKLAGAVANDADSDKVLSHVLPIGWLDEHGAQWMFDNMAQALERNAPEVLYDAASKQEA